MLSNRSVACWGDNSGDSWAALCRIEQRLRGHSRPASRFEAGAVDAGSATPARPGWMKLVCWGRNTDGQLGRGTSSSSEAPGYVTLPSG